MDLPAKIGTGGIKPETLRGANSKILSQPLRQLQMRSMFIKVTKYVFMSEFTHIPSILIRQKYYIMHFHFDNKLIIKQKL